MALGKLVSSYFSEPCGIIPRKEDDYLNFWYRKNDKQMVSWWWLRSGDVPQLNSVFHPLYWMNCSYYLTHIDLDFQRFWIVYTWANAQIPSTVKLLTRGLAAHCQVQVLFACPSTNWPVFHMFHLNVRQFYKDTLRVKHLRVNLQTSSGSNRPLIASSTWCLRSRTADLDSRLAMCLQTSPWTAAQVLWGLTNDSTTE